MIVTGLTLAGAALPKIVVASDCRNANPNELTPRSHSTRCQIISRAILGQGSLLEHWLWVFACRTICLIEGLLQLLHAPTKDPQRLSRKWRVGFRFVTTLIWTLLPLATKSTPSNSSALSQDRAIYAFSSKSTGKAMLAKKFSNGRTTER